MADSMADVPTITNSMSKLAQLPEELVSNISIKLGSDDIFAFRLTCKALEQKSFHEFATEYYHSKAFVFTTESLKVLLNIAQHDRLRGHLQNVYFMPALYSSRAFDCPRGCHCR